MRKDSKNQKTAGVGRNHIGSDQEHDVHHDAHLHNEASRPATRKENRPDLKVRHHHKKHGK